MADITLGIIERRVLLDSQHKLAQDVERISHQWCEDMFELRRRDRDFAVRLAESATPQQALTLCASWMTERMGKLAAAQHQLLTCWVDLALFHASHQTTTRSETAASGVQADH